MSRFAVTFAAGAALMFSAQVSAQQLAPLPAGVPEKIPFDIPYGAPISMDMAKKAVEATLAESAKRGWKMAVAVVSPSGDLTYFAKMDDTQLIASEIAPKKARAAATFRRETKVFFDAMETGHPYVLTLDPNVVASPGGIPIVVGGKLIGGIGCSGGIGSQDAVVCQAGVDSLGK
jgi:glc operon protein GlcG